MHQCKFLDSSTPLRLRCGAGFIGIKGSPAYTAAKHGVIGLTRPTALDYAAHNIRVLVLNGKINPGKVFDLTLALDQGAEGYSAMDERRAIKSLLRPNGTN